MIIVPRAFGLKMEHPVEVVVDDPLTKIFLRIAESFEVFQRNVYSAAKCILADISQDVGELKGDACEFGQLQGLGIAEAENVQANQTDDGRHAVAVRVKLFKRFVAVFFN